MLGSVRESKHDKHVVFVFSDHGQLGFYSPYITHQAQVVQKLGNVIHRINHCYPVLLRKPIALSVGLFYPVNSAIHL